MSERELALRATVKSMLRAKTGKPLADNGTAASPGNRVAELEIENLRLQALVAELLIKNQELRGALHEFRRTSG